MRRFVEAQMHLAKNDDEKNVSHERLRESRVNRVIQRGTGNLLYFRSAFCAPYEEGGARSRDLSADIGRWKRRWNLPEIIKGLLGDYSYLPPLPLSRKGEGRKRKLYRRISRCVGWTIGENAGYIGAAFFVFPGEYKNSGILMRVASRRDIYDIALKF